MHSTPSYVARGFYLTGAEFLKLDPQTQRHVLDIVERGSLRDFPVGKRGGNNDGK